MYSSSVLLPEECEYKIIIIIINVLNTQRWKFIILEGWVGFKDPGNSAREGGLEAAQLCPFW